MEKFIKRKARKQYRCECPGDPDSEDGCTKVINKGDEYWYYHTFIPADEDDPKHWSYSAKYHIDCHLTKEQVLERQKTCPHEHVEMMWDYIPGEAVGEPSYDYCVDCGKVMK